MKQIKITLANRYRLERYLASGSYGEVFEAIDLKTNQHVAVKVAPIKRSNTLQVEKEFYDRLQPRRGAGMLKVHFFSQECDDYRILVLPLLGPSLKDLFYYCEERFTLRTVLLIADQVLARLKFLHSRDIIHRDLKPANFILGRGYDGNTIYLVDLGCALKKVHAPGDPMHYGRNREDRVYGTIGYASKAAHMLQCQTYRDDLESFGYIMMEFLNKRLPWEDIESTGSQSKEELIGQMKEQIPLDDLCKIESDGSENSENSENSDDPIKPDDSDVFKKYFEYIRKLRYNQRPDYTWLQNLFRLKFRDKKYKYNHVYDWTERKFEEFKSALPEGAEGTDDAGGADGADGADTA
ncbi:kinase-like protein [Aspergillus sclerotioniger CBS 115572]|uniref:non-specific serine/threonine protein kinase n=1 Tax=Aspergillus sclerotioniger CBS 115572 TaxID=1450535 RepID=A0A317X2S0_9EURO|nr:kinase-like protein [Aspergillus sclerotioniger CBS 115572]PWY91797.1 kinase-like protein [Aspergillus sclerotioniger CBS 115572]